jgi:hypothetical protein
MRQLCLVLSLAVVGLVVLAVAPAADAQATRTWVSGVGDDVNPCSRTAPCKTFAGAISKTAAGGEISALDPGGFGAVTITKAITINGEGTLASIVAGGTSGIIVNAAAGDKVIIRNISILGSGSSAPGLIGVRYIAGGQVTLEKVTITGFLSPTAGQGRAVDATLAAGGELIVQDSSFTNCKEGVRLTTTAGQLLASFDNVRITNMAGFGLEASAGSTFVTIKHSNISHNNADGVRVAANGPIINVEDTVLAFNNGAAVNAAANGARLRIANNTIVNNATGIAITPGGFVQSPGNNRVDGNGANAAPNQGYTQQ